jgi:hypothetical protein
MVMAAGPKIMMNKPGKINKMETSTSGTNINHPELESGQMKRIMIRTPKRRRLARQASIIAIPSKSGPIWTPVHSEAVLSREMSLLS